MANAGLKDVWDERPNSDDGSGETCERDCNYYTHLNKRVYEKFQDGMRIDYIMYNGCHSYKVQCTDARLVMRKIPGSALSPSDHEALSATLEIQYCKDTEPPSLSADLPSLLEDVKDEFVSAYNAVQQKRLVSAGLATCFALLLAVLQLTSITDIICAKSLICAILVIGFFLCIWDICVQRVFEASAFCSLIENVRIRMLYIKNDKT
ncbi:sphingomyelin phosphodiesterase 2-like [Anneissia japonica]|uniref:sphingomyelin phosphodiesterase 2-like n=1 Tax=Anneissia japonica TaxID=1529436 RepID=UPI001425A16F|nr:sphingomyelin phosphodiesterase 2-like [Anneissia japonica]XP_033104840.1 sphingomyelin phosphodiesterase 2-like [Anneissia japonica]